MNILIVDDELLAINTLKRIVKELLPKSNIFTFTEEEQALEFSKQTFCDVAFLDVQMRGMCGIELAKHLKDIVPNMNIIFVTGYNEYAVDAIKVRISGYLLKPVKASEVKEELENLRNPVVAKQTHIRAQTFGNFELFVDNKPLSFKRSKSKELLAYLIHRNGASCTSKEIAAVLFEDRPYDHSARSQLHTVFSGLVKDLSEENAEKIIRKSFNSFSVDVSLFDCDRFNFEKWDVAAINSYKGEYMAQYSWAEFFVPYLDSQTINK